MRFQLIDKITSLERGESITATKNLSLAEEYLADHFPGFPVMPGVLMLESLVQTGAWLMRFSEDFKYSTVLLKQAKALKFNSFLKPGHSMTVEAKVHRRDGNEFVFKATGQVDGVSTVSARLVLEQFNLADKNASLAASDTVLTESMKKLFAQLWKPDPET
ncbi:MAG: beta-hydroxyacyl-ACP dehydratase [Planctomycetota bacterium]|nr:beta-hydroxyacyl-ACP dehydratase [Planctomycetota bacterium]